MKTKILMLILSLGFIFPVTSIAAKMAMPKPPQQNPHPAKTLVDQKRVQFAKDVIDAFLVKDQIKPDQSVSSKWINAKGQKINVTRDCLKVPSCYEKQADLLKQVRSIKNRYGSVTILQHIHIIPWSMNKFKANKKTPATAQSQIRYSKNAGASLVHSSAYDRGVIQMPTPEVKKDEYLLHSYVKFSSGKRWYHLDVIVSEDENGTLEFRGFFVVPMPNAGRPLPPGVVC